LRIDVLYRLVCHSRAENAWMQTGERMVLSQSEKVSVVGRVHITIIVMKMS
jgi:hypothetical protein